jgi:hypothetical protein
MQTGFGTSADAQGKPSVCVCCVQRCPTRDDKTVVLKDMIFPLCEKLGQTIIFVRTRDTARRLHQHVRQLRAACCVYLSFSASSNGGWSPA